MLRGEWQQRVRRSSTGLLLIFWTCLLAAPQPAPGQVEVPDFLEDFEGQRLDSDWVFSDGYAAAHPDDVAQHSTFRVGDSHLTLSIPGGVGHNQWFLEHAQVTRPYQGSGVYEIKVDSTFDENQQFGLVFESSRGSFIMCMLYTDYYVRAYVEQFALEGETQYRHPAPEHTTFLRSPQRGPFYIRVTLQDDVAPEKRSWKFEWSRDSVEWTTAHDGVAESAETGGNIAAIERVGVFAGNHGDEFTAFDARFDYFESYPVSRLPPETPRNLLASAKDASVALAWDPVASASGYELHRSTTPGGPYVRIGRGPEPRYLDTGLDDGTTYYYIARSYNDQGNSSASTEVAATPRSDTAVRLPPTLTPPEEIPPDGLILLLDAGNAALEAADGEKVTLWRDASGRQNDAIATAGRAPVLASDAIAGRPALHFDGTDDYFSLPAGFEDFTDGLSLFVVLRPQLLQPGFKILALGNEAARHAIVLGRNGVESRLQYFDSSSDGRSREIVTSPVLEVDESRAFSVLQSGGAENGRAATSVQMDGEAVGTGSTLVPPVRTRSLNYIGKSYWNEGRFQGDVAEIILYDRLLDPKEAAAVEDYLYRKYHRWPAWLR